MEKKKDKTNYFKLRDKICNILRAESYHYEGKSCIHEIYLDGGFVMKKAEEILKEMGLNKPKI